MDSNGTRFQLILGRDDWARCTDQSGVPILGSADLTGTAFAWDPTRNELTLGVRTNVFHSAPGNVPPSIGQRRGASQDRFSNFYWIADSGTEILVNSNGTSLTTHFWSSTDEVSAGCNTPESTFGFCAVPAVPVALPFRGLTVTTQHYLVAGVLEPAGFVVFDLFHGGPPRQFVWPAAVPFVPFDMAAAPDGGVYILDRVNARVWMLDRTFAVVAQGQSQVPLPGAPDLFGPAAGPPPQPPAPLTFPSGIALEMASPLNSINPVAIAALPDGSVLILRTDPSSSFSSIYRFRSGSQVGVAVSLSMVVGLLEPQDRPGFQLRGYDFAFVAMESTPFGQRQNTLYVVGQNGDQVWAFTVDFGSPQLALTPLPEYYPMRVFEGKGLIAGQTQVFYDSLNGWVPITMQKRPRYVAESVLITRVFNGKQPDCVWDKLILDASIPSETDIVVFSRAHNDAAHLAIQNWNQEPSPYRRGDGSELPWVQEAPGLSAWELLLQQAAGQYFQLMIVLSGSGRATPRIRALRAYYPRFSYTANYLPAVFRQNPQSAWFLDRFLGNFQGFFTSTEDRIASVQALLDARSAPAEALDWLANWFGVALDPAWSTVKRRLFLENAAMFFEARGTLTGLMMALRLALEDCADQSIFSGKSKNTGVRLVEKFTSRVLPLGMLQDSATDAGLPVQLQTNMWTPSQRADDLDQRYRAALQLAADATYPIVLSSTDPQYPAWRSFSQGTLGFIPAQPDSISTLWTTFLKSRYGAISALNGAYLTSYGSFTDVPFPATLPRRPRPLLDWYQFQGMLLIDASAHRFTVYLPLAPGDAQSTAAQQAKVSLAQRVVELEKPAHASYDIQFYWAFFRVGSARLGQDSILDQGSRAPQLLPPAILGQTYAGSGYLSQDLPGDLRRRPFLQRSC